MKKTYPNEEYSPSGYCSRKGCSHLHSIAKTENRVEGRFFLNVIITKGATVLELFASKNKASQVGRNAFSVLDLGLHIVDRVRGLDFQCDCFVRKGLDKDLHASTEAKDKMKGRLLQVLDAIIVRQGATVLKLFAGKDKALLVGRNTSRGNGLTFSAKQS